LRQRQIVTHHISNNRVCVRPYKYDPVTVPASLSSQHGRQPVYDEDPTTFNS